jgi:hypothetical protein
MNRIVIPPFLFDKAFEFSPAKPVLSEVERTPSSFIPVEFVFLGVLCASARDTPVCRLPTSDSRSAGREIDNGTLEKNGIRSLSPAAQPTVAPESAAPAPAP